VVGPDIEAARAANAGKDSPPNGDINATGWLAMEEAVRRHRGVPALLYTENRGEYAPCGKATRKLEVAVGYPVGGWVGGGLTDAALKLRCRLI